MKKMCFINWRFRSFVQYMNQCFKYVIIRGCTVKHCSENMIKKTLLKAKVKVTESIN